MTAVYRRCVPAARMAAIVQEVRERWGDDAGFVVNEVSNLSVVTGEGVYVAYVDMLTEELVWVNRPLGWADPPLGK